MRSSRASSNGTYQQPSERNAMKVEKRHCKSATFKLLPFQGVFMVLVSPRVLPWAMCSMPFQGVLPMLVLPQGCHGACALYPFRACSRCLFYPDCCHGECALCPFRAVNSLAEVELFSIQTAKLRFFCQFSKAARGFLSFHHLIYIIYAHEPPLNLISQFPIRKRKIDDLCN